MQTIGRHLSLIGLLMMIPLVGLQAQSTDKEVYRAALNYFYTQVIEPPGTRCITLCDEYVELSLIGTTIPDKLEKIDPELGKSFLINNAYGTLVKHFYDTPSNVEYSYERIVPEEFTAYLHKLFDDVPYIHIISEEESLELSKRSRKLGGFYKRLFRKYPCSGGLLFLSHIGYNEDKTKAMFYLENLFHNLAGGGFLAVCELVNDKWEIEIIAVMQV